MFTNRLLQVSMVATLSVGIISCSEDELDVPAIPCDFAATYVEGTESSNVTYSFSDQGQITQINLGEVQRAEITYNDQGSVASITFFERDEQGKSQAFDYSADGNVESVDVERPGQADERTEFTYETGDGVTVVTAREYEETPTSGEFEATGEYTVYTVTNGNVTAFTAYATEGNGTVVELESGVVTYGSDAWRVDLAILFDLDDHPVLSNTNIPSSVTVTSEGETVFSGEFEVEKTGDFISAVTHTFQEEGNTRTKAITFEELCDEE